MKTINAPELSVLLDIDKKSAVKKIIVCLDKHKLDYDQNDTKNAEVCTKVLSKHLGIDFMFYIKNIQEKYLITSSTRGYIFNYPADEKLKVNKKTGLLPKSVCIPKFISQFLTEDQKNIIVQEWKDRYNSKDEYHFVVFKK